MRRNPWGRRNGSGAEIAGGCREGGLVRRIDATGAAVIVRQREICDSIARAPSTGRGRSAAGVAALPLAVVRAAGLRGPHTGAMPYRRRAISHSGSPGSQVRHTSGRTA